MRSKHVQIDVFTLVASETV